VSESEKGREWLLGVLKDAILFSEKKYKHHNRKDESSLKWCRCMIQACEKYGRIWESEEIELRIERLEKAIKDGVIIPVEKQ